MDAIALLLHPLLLYASLLTHLSCFKYCVGTELNLTRWSSLILSKDLFHSREDYEKGDKFQSLGYMEERSQ